MPQTPTVLPETADAHPIAPVPAVEAEIAALHLEFWKS